MNFYKMNNGIVSVEWLKNNLDDKNLVILDSSPESNVSGLASENEELCIPNSRHFDIDKNFSNKESAFPNTVPSPHQFEKECRALGINNSSKIVVYDNLGIYTSPRVWWLFKAMGHEDVAVLNGGLIEWIEKGYKTINTSERTNECVPGDFKSRYHKNYVIAYEEILDNIQSNEFQVIDARPAGRFQGTAKEPRKHLKSGSIPNSINIPYKELIENGKFKSSEELKEIFNRQVEDDSKKMVFSCGSGLTACIVMLASEIAFKKSPFLYDGSWTEYAELQNLREDID